jgi:hypothetical protein
MATLSSFRIVSAGATGGATTTTGGGGRGQPWLDAGPALSGHCVLFVVHPIAIPVGDGTAMIPGHPRDRAAGVVFVIDAVMVRIGHRASVVSGYTGIVGNHAVDIVIGIGGTTVPFSVPGFRASSSSGMPSLSVSFFLIGGGVPEDGQPDAREAPKPGVKGAGIVAYRNWSVPGCNRDSA